MDYTNFLDETLYILHQNGKTEADVRWVGRKDFASSWEQFKAVADFDYDSGYGSEYIATDLVVVGADFWLEREEYDGNEGWVFKTMPTMPGTVRPLTHSDCRG